MRWQGRRQSGNIEDRRGQGGFQGGLGGGGPRIRIGGARGGGGLGLGFIAVILIVGWIAGVNPLDLLSQMEGGGPISTSAPQQQGEMGTPADEGAQFVATILADTEDTWSGIFAANGRRYEAPTLVLFDGSTQSACGFASAATGPFYCPGDRKVYIDLAFYDQLKSQFQAPGDFAQAYVVAHEIGHHVQNLLGILPKVDELRRQSSEVDANKLTVRLELQADCLAGIWAHEEERRGFLEVGDIDEALNAAAQIGDDTLQKRGRGYVVPDSFTHGTSEQRSRWFKRGYNQGAIDACDTYSAVDI